MGPPVRIVHYLNQFFAGIGAEDKADAPPQYRPGPVGPGTALAALLGGQATIVGTLVCGDNYFIEHQDAAITQLLAMAEAHGGELLVTGPAFNSGRYGTACGALAEAWQQRGKPAVTAMNDNNPGVELFRGGVYILPTGPSAASMNDVLPKLAAFALRLGQGAEIGPAETEGYFPSGTRRNLRAPAGAAERAAEMLVAKLSGQPFRTELPVPDFSAVPPATPVASLENGVPKSIEVALVTECGLVPSGNPDRLESWNASKWLKYPIAGVYDLQSGDYEACHGGCDTAGTNADPDRTVPLDAARALEQEGVLRLHDHYYVTTGNMANIKTMSKIGQEIALDLKNQGVEAAILTAT